MEKRGNTESDANKPGEPEVEPSVAEAITRRSSLVVLADAALAVEGVRVAAQVRLKHLAKRNETCPDTQELLDRTRELEGWVDGQLASRIKAHPASPWFSQVKGTGGELIGKVIGLIEAFGRYYEQGDPQIPVEVKRPAVEVNGKQLVWVEGIERCITPSKLRKYAGLAPGQKRVGGEKLNFNQELRTMLWRLGSSFLKARNKYYEFYSGYKDYLVRRCAAEGIRILPTPSGRFCPVCEKEVIRKTAKFCPDCGTVLSKKGEPEGVRWEGHIHMMAQHRMMQLFLDHLWVVWREALGLSLRRPYPIEYLGHSQIIGPWDMV